MRYVITGANRGIGLELARQLLARGDDVVAGVRRPDAADALTGLDGAERLTVLQLDVTDSGSVAAFADAVGDAPIDVLVNNAGVGGERTALENVDMADAMRVYDTNVLGPLRVTGALLPHLRRGGTRKIVHISSGLGSIADNDTGGAYAYRMSKAALNMGCRSMARDLGGEGFIAVVVNPGWVQTDMGGRSAPTPVEESAEKIITLVDQIGPDDNGTFLDYRGHTWPW